MARERKPLAPSKVALIHVARKECGLPDHAYRDLLRLVEGVSSASELSEDGFRLAMDVFAHLGFQSYSNRRNFGRRPGFATAGQLETIRRLWSDYTGGLGTEAELGRWLEHSFGVSALRFLPAKQGPKVIAALRAMCGRRKALSTAPGAA